MSLVFIKCIHLSCPSYDQLIWMTHEELGPRKLQNAHGGQQPYPIQPSISCINKDIDPYKILALRRDATMAEIVSSYRRLAILKHPRRRQKSTRDCDSTTREWEFIVLSASYETLKTHRYRRAYDDLYRRQERKNQRILQRRQKDARRKHVTTFNRYHDSSTLHRMKKGIPCLLTGPNIFRTKTRDLDETTTTSMTSAPSIQCDAGAFLKLSFDSEEDIIHNSSSLENSFSYEEEEFPPTSADVDHKSDMYQGPLGLIYRARNYENFSDPYELFHTEFGSDVFSLKYTGEGLENESLDDYVHHTHSPYMKESSSSLPGSSVESLIKHDSWDEEVACTTNGGDFAITKTSRILGTSKITRIETIQTDPKTGLKQKLVEVLREDIDDELSISSSEGDISTVEPKPILSCLAGHPSNLPPSPIHNDSIFKDPEKDKLTLKNLLCGCGHFIP